jgi:hypothetical protein
MSCVLLLVAVVLSGTTGLSCDDDVVKTFRDTAVDDIASGLTTIVTAIIDGVAAAIKSVGDAGTTS